MYDLIDAKVYFFPHCHKYFGTFSAKEPYLLTKGLAVGAEIAINRSAQAPCTAQRHLYPIPFLADYVFFTVPAVDEMIADL